LKLFYIKIDLKLSSYGILGKTQLPFFKKIAELFDGVKEKRDNLREE